MGLFDYVRCEYPLPGNPPECARDAHFQTKDLTCYMEQYTITAEGRLIHESGTEDHSKFTGHVDLYWNNIVASGPGIYTANGEDAHCLEYRVVFVDGRVSSVEVLQDEKQPAAKRKPRVWPTPTPEEIAEREKRLSESLVGRTICVWWGGNTSKPYDAKVVAENERSIVAKSKERGFEVIDRHQRDNCFFDSLEDGQRHNDDRKAKWEAERREYEAEIAAKKTGVTA